MKSYQDLGLTDRLKPADGLAGRPSEFQNALTYNLEQEPTPYLHRMSVLNRGGTLRTGLGAIIDFRSANDGTSLITYNPATGAITLRGPITSNGSLQLGSSLTMNAGGTAIYNAPVIFNAAVTFGSTITGGLREMRWELMEEGAFTGNNDFEFGGGPAQNQYPRIQLISSQWDANSLDFYYEFVANADTGNALVSRLVDITNGTVAVASTTGTSGTTSEATRIRVGPFTLVSGTIEYAMQFHRVGTTANFPAAVSSAIVAIMK